MMKTRMCPWLKHSDISVKYEKIKFLVIALQESIEIYAWAPKPYHKFMAFKVGHHFKNFYRKSSSSKDFIFFPLGQFEESSNALYPVKYVISLVRLKYNCLTFFFSLSPI